MQDDKSFVNHLLSLSTELPGTSAAAPTTDVASPIAQAPGAISTKLNDLVGRDRNEVCHQKWHNVNFAGPDAGDNAAQVSSAALLESIKAEQA